METVNVYRKLRWTQGVSHRIRLAADLQVGPEHILFERTRSHADLFRDNAD